MAPITLKDPDCLICMQPHIALYHVDSGTYRFGDILRQYESVHRPILAALADPISNSEQHRLVPNNNAHVTTDGRQRPSVFWSDMFGITQPAAGPFEVSLCTSYDNTFYFRDLPMILRDHFAIPISPHVEIRSGAEHLHMSPEWRRPHTWLIAIIFCSYGKLEGHWNYQDEFGGRHRNLGYRIETERLDELMHACAERWDGWVARCNSNPTSLSRCRWEYEVRAPQVYLTSLH